MKELKAIAIALWAIGLPGCALAPPPITITYSPSTDISASGSVSVAEFNYLPASQGLVAPNQVSDSGSADLLVSRRLDELFKESVLAEFELSGINVDNAKRILTGEIIDFYVDDISTMHWTLVVEYQVTNDPSGAVLYQSRKITKRSSRTFGNESLCQIFRENIEALLKDPQFIGVINKPIRTAAAVTRSDTR